MTNPANRVKFNFSKLYTTLAIITLNTVILLGFGLLILHFVVPYSNQSTAGPSGINSVYSNNFIKKSYQFVSRDEAIAVGLEYDQWAQDGHWQVHPWTGLISREFAGQYLNIDVDGIRQTTKPNPIYDDKPTLRLWIFGGSTMFGWGLADDWTIASQLQTDLQEQIPDYQIRVTNFGAPIYASSQELALFVANLRLQEPPHAVIFMDGVNDVWFTMYGDTQTALVTTLSTAWETQISEIMQPQGQPWFAVNRTFPLQRLQSQLTSNDTDELNELWQAHADYSMQYVYTGEDEERLARIIDTYRFNRTTITQIAEDNGILPLFFLQPWDDPFYSRFQQSVQTNLDTINISNIFEDINTSTNPVYLDDFHYSDFGSQVIAEKIGDELMKRNLIAYVEPDA